ncbi:MAG: hypothetical protein WCP21_07705, partial [Armatimonadota bacterium]
GRLRALAAGGEFSQADRVAVGLMPVGDDGMRHQRWYVVTVDGTQLEGQPDKALPVSQPAWRAKVQQDEGGYTAEFAFPRSLLGTDLQPPFNLFRYAAPGGELYMTGRFAHRDSPMEFGELVFHR